MSFEETLVRERQVIGNSISRLQRVREMVGNVNTNEEVEKIESDLDEIEGALERFYSRDIWNRPKSRAEAEKKVNVIADEFDLSQKRLQSAWRIRYLDECTSLRKAWKHFVEDFKSQYPEAESL